jgi:hypothetical protein
LSKDKCKKLCSALRLKFRRMDRTMTRGNFLANSTKNQTRMRKQL